ncbi:CHRD domain-containing protein [Phormidium tenue FACHB-886]|nr:CHRD domain-containing protein [Phormidium tenue FACHB-886]
MPGGGKNTVIGSGDTDVIVGAGRGFNTITTGGGFDTIVLGAETTNRIFDFDPTKDRFVLASNIDASNIVIAQGTNKNKGGVGTPLDFEKNALVIDKSNNHILASLNFTDASKLSEGTFKKLNPFALVGLASAQFDNVKVGDGKQTGTQKRDLLVGKGGDDFLYVGDDGFKIGTATGGGGTEFPFPTDSPGTSEITGTLQNGVLKLEGSYKNFDGAPLFSQGEDSIDSNAKILNGSDPVALVEGFKKVPQDSEGNKLSGTHLHFSPAEDSRGNFADATVVRYFSETPTDAKSGKISGEFELSSEEQAAFLAGNLYVNIHTNVDVDKDGKAGFPTGENRLNLNQNMVQFV